MSIIKRIPDNIGFTMVSNEILQDNTMSLAARGLLAYLLSKPPDWKINVSNMLEQFPEGRVRVNKAWKELKELGYVRKTQKRDAGRILGWEYEVSQCAASGENNIVENHNVETSIIESHNVETCRHIKKEETKQTKNKETEEYPLTPRGGNQTAEPLVDDSNPEEPKKRKVSAAKLELPSWLSRESWEDFVEHRKALRKPMTPKAGELILAKLKTIAKEHGEQAAQEAILNSIAAGWQGVFPPKGSTSANSQLDEWDLIQQQLQGEGQCNPSSFYAS